jgi:hypothetical protein
MASYSHSSSQQQPQPHIPPPSQKYQQSHPQQHRCGGGATSGSNLSLNSTNNVNDMSTTLSYQQRAHIARSDRAMISSSTREINTSPMSTSIDKSLNNVCRASSGNSSFTSSSVTRKEMSRMSTLNRSFNNAASMATDFRRKLHKIADTNNRYGGGGNKGAADDKATSDRHVEDFLSAAANSGGRGAASPTDMMRKFSQKVKSQVQSSLSDPLKARELIMVHKILGDESGGVMSPLARTSSMRKKVTNISNRLQLPRFFSDNGSTVEGHHTQAMAGRLGENRHSNTWGFGIVYFGIVYNRKLARVTSFGILSTCILAYRFTLSLAD